MKRTLFNTIQTPALWILLGLFSLPSISFSSEMEISVETLQAAVEERHDAVEESMKVAFDMMNGFHSSVEAVSEVYYGGFQDGSVQAFKKYGTPDLTPDYTGLLEAPEPKDWPSVIYPYSESHDPEITARNREEAEALKDWEVERWSDILDDALMNYEPLVSTSVSARDPFQIHKAYWQWWVQQRKDAIESGTEMSGDRPNFSGYTRVFQEGGLTPERAAELNAASTEIISNIARNLSDEEGALVLPYDDSDEYYELYEDWYDWWDMDAERNAQRAASMIEAYEREYPLRAAKLEYHLNSSLFQWKERAYEYYSELTDFDGTPEDLITGFFPCGAQFQKAEIQWIPTSGGFESVLGALNQLSREIERISPYFLNSTLFDPSASGGVQHVNHIETDGRSDSWVPIGVVNRDNYRQQMVRMAARINQLRCLKWPMVSRFPYGDTMKETSAGATLRFGVETMNLYGSEFSSLQSLSWRGSARSFLSRFSFYDSQTSQVKTGARVYSDVPFVGSRSGLGNLFVRSSYSFGGRRLRYQDGSIGDEWFNVLVKPLAASDTSISGLEYDYEVESLSETPSEPIATFWSDLEYSHAPFRGDRDDLSISALAKDPSDSFAHGKKLDAPFWEEGNQIKFEYETTDWLPKVTQNDGHTGAIELDFQVVCYPNFTHSFDLDGFLAASFSPSMQIDDRGGACRLVFPVDTSLGVAGEETILALNLSKGDGNPEFLQYPFWGLLSLEGDISSLNIESGSPSREISAIYRRNYLGGFELVDDPASIYKDQTREPIVSIEAPQVDLEFRWEGPYSMTLTYKDKSGKEVAEYKVKMLGESTNFYSTPQDYPESLATVEVFRGDDKVGILRFTDEYSGLASTDGERWSYEDLSNGGKTLVQGSSSFSSTKYVLGGATLTSASSDPTGVPSQVGGYSKVSTSSFASWSEGEKSVSSTMYEHDAPTTEIDHDWWGGGSLWPPHDAIFTYSSSSEPVAPMPSQSVFAGANWTRNGEVLEFEKDGSVSRHDFLQAGIPSSRSYSLAGDSLTETLTVSGHELAVTSTEFLSNGSVIETDRNGVVTTTEFYTTSAGNGLPWQVKSVSSLGGVTNYEYVKSGSGELLVRSTHTPPGNSPEVVSESSFTQTGAISSERVTVGGIEVSDTSATGHSSGFLGRPTDFATTRSGISSFSSVQYTDTGEVSRVEYPDGRVDELKWDSWRRLDSGTGINGVGWNPSYDGLNVSASFGGKSIALERDIEGTVISTSSEIGKGSHSAFDPLANKTSFSLPNEGGRGITSSFHADGALEAVSPGLGSPGRAIEYSVEQAGGYYCIATKFTLTDENDSLTDSWVKRYVNGYGQLMLVETPHPSGIGVVSTSYHYSSDLRTVTITPPSPSKPQVITYSPDRSSYTVQTGNAGGPLFSSETTQVGARVTTEVKINNEKVSSTIQNIATSETEIYSWSHPTPVVTTSISSDGNQKIVTGLNGNSMTITSSHRGVEMISGTQNGEPFELDASNRDKFGFLESLSIDIGGAVGEHLLSFTGTNRVSSISGPAVNASFSTTFENGGVDVSGTDHISGQSIGSALDKTGELKSWLRAGRQDIDFTGSALAGVLDAGVQGFPGQLLTQTFGPTGALLSERRNDGTGTDYSWHGDGRLEKVEKVDPTGNVPFTFTYHPENGLPTGYEISLFNSLVIHRDSDGTVTGITKKDTLPAAGPYSEEVTFPEYEQGKPSKEVFSGFLSGLSLERDYNSATGKLTEVRLSQDGQLVHQIQWEYSSDGKLESVEAPMIGYAASYSYLDFETTLSSGIGEQNRVLMQDGSGRLDRITMESGLNTFQASLSYLGGSPKRQTLSGGGRLLRWTYDYNSGQLQEAGSNQGDRLVYNHDGMGNRANGSATGSNQYLVYRSPSGSHYTVSGTVEPDAEVYIRHGEPGPGITLGGTPVLVNPNGSFQAEFRVPTSGTAQAIPIKVVAVLPGQGTDGTDAVSRKDLILGLAPSEGPMSYGAHGAVASDPRWNYHWSVEGRLNGMDTRESVVSVGVEKVILKFAYDYQGRRVWKQSQHYSDYGAVLSRTVTTRFVYDGWLLLGEFREEVDHLSGGPPAYSHRFYTWGSDVSGSLQGAGGVGGLVAINDSEGGLYAPVYDVAGNVTALIDSDGNEVAHWKLGPFGEVLEESGRTDLCPVGFATKYMDEESGLVYFGYRYYSPQSGRWLSREPLGEFESFNLYAYCHNDPIGKVDYLGLNEVDLWGQYFDLSGLTDGVEAIMEFLFGRFEGGGAADKELDTSTGVSGFYGGAANVLSAGMIQADPYANGPSAAGLWTGRVWGGGVASPLVIQGGASAPALSGAYSWGGRATYVYGGHAVRTAWGNPWVRGGGYTFGAAVFGGTGYELATNPQSRAEFITLEQATGIPGEGLMIFPQGLRSAGRDLRTAFQGFDFLQFSSNANKRLPIQLFPEPVYVVPPSSSLEESGNTVRLLLPDLPETFAREFDGPVRLRTFKAGEKVYRSPWVPEELIENPGAWFGTRRTATQAGTDSMYQISKWENPNSVLRAFEFTQDVTVYYGKVKGGTGYQLLFPKDITPGDVLRFIVETELR